MTSLLDAAMQKSWTPTAQLSMEAMKNATQATAAMDKASTTKIKKDKSNSGLGSIIGAGAGLAASMIPGMQPFAVALMAGGGALGGGAESAMNGTDVASGATGGAVTGAVGGLMGPGLAGAKDWASVLGTAAEKTAEGGAATGVGLSGLGGVSEAAMESAAVPTSLGAPAVAGLTPAAGSAGAAAGSLGSVTPTYDYQNILSKALTKNSRVPFLS